MNILQGLCDAAIGVATLPVTVVADIVTMGGVLTDRETSYTGDQLGKIMQDIVDEDET
jgi:hypothetical protein